ncbi:MAG: alpha/beta hydrolase fold domain-containing protein [Clostridia bacterium]|nr:alpha/beta hydrolase fold domain-containing protein [Clostridia bacterium]
MAQLQVEYYSNCLIRPVQFKVLLPNDPNDQWPPEQKFKDRPMKTLFLLHGYTGAAGNWVPERLPALYNFAVVMPSGENGFWIDGLSTGHRYDAFLGVELVDYVRRTFHLALTPEDTCVMGLSMGGYGALHVALAHPDRFGAAAGLSSALIVHGIAHMKPGDENPVANYEYYRECFGDLETVEQSRNNPEVLVDELLAAKKPLPKLFMACGTEDFLLEPNRQFHAFLEQRGVEHQCFESPGGHDMTFWTEYAEKMCALMFGEE